MSLSPHRCNSKSKRYKSQLIRTTPIINTHSIISIQLEDGVQAASNALLAYSQRAPVVASAPSDQVQSKVLARLRDPASAQNKPLPQQPFWARGQAANLKFSKHEVRRPVKQKPCPETEKLIPSKFCAGSSSCGGGAQVEDGGRSQSRT
jgi:hypothetical protein